MQKTQKKKTIRGKDWKAQIRKFLNKELVRPPLIVVVVFLAIFFIFYGIFSGLESVISFVIGENVGAITVLILSVVLEKRIAPEE